MTERTKTARPIDRYFASYADDHRNTTNQQIHAGGAGDPVVGSSPAVVHPGRRHLVQQRRMGGVVDVRGLVVLQPAIASARAGHAGDLLFFGCLCRLLEGRLGLTGLFATALTVFVLAWVAQFVGHRIEGRKPSFLTDLTYLLIGPIWVLAKLYRQLGWRY